MPMTLNRLRYSILYPILCTGIWLLLIALHEDASYFLMEWHAIADRSWLRCHVNFYTKVVSAKYRVINLYSQAIVFEVVHFSPYNRPDFLWLRPSRDLFLMIGSLKERCELIVKWFCGTIVTRTATCERVNSGFTVNLTNTLIILCL